MKWGFQVIILIGAIKGGAGKSTLATNVATMLAKKSKDVILVDADRQGTTSNWSQDRADIEVTHIESVSKYDNIKLALRDLNKRYEFVVVDSQGRDSVELRTGLLSADLCLIPCRPSQADLDTIPLINTLINNAREINEPLRAYCVLTQSPTNPSITEIQQAKEFLTEFGTEMKLLKTIIFERKVYRDALAQGLGVCEMDNEKAIAEMNGVFSEVGL